MNMTPCDVCGKPPAVRPYVYVLNHDEGTGEKVHLDLPPMCLACAEKKLGWRKGLFVPVTEAQPSDEAVDVFRRKLPAWQEKFGSRSIEKVMQEWGISDEEEARKVLGLPPSAI